MGNKQITTFPDVTQFTIFSFVEDNEKRFWGLQAAVSDKEVRQ